MKSKKVSRIKRATKIRFTNNKAERPRLCVFRTPKHTYAQIISADKASVLATATSQSKDFPLENRGNVEAAVVIGKLIAEKAKDLGIEEVAFDRSGFKYHGRVQALADSARENGLKF
jgi:large subunit ribosomal protein L18